VTGLSNRDRERLRGVHPNLVAVVEKAREKVEFMVVEGVRSDEQCCVNFGKGRNRAAMMKAGVPSQWLHFADPRVPKITWVDRPFATKHRIGHDGYGHAVDLLPAPYDWKMDAKGEPFTTLAQAMFQAAQSVGAIIRWGADWNQNGKPREKGETDSPHFELE
jgi:peptidoglycan L-alanyl-D-glutamate endopeptidase CwlK